MRCNRSPQRVGATLIELLVVAAVIFVLLGLTIPIIRHIRVRQDDLLDVANAGHTLKDFRLWSADRDDIMPNAGHFEDPIVPEYYAEYDANLAAHYVLQVQEWVRLMCLSGFEPSEHWHTTRGPDDASGQIDLTASDAPDWLYANPSRFLLTATLLFDSDIWTPSGNGPWSWGELPLFFRRVRWGAVAFPSSKGMIVNRSRRYGADLWHVGFVDGSARMIKASDSLPGVPYPWGGDGPPILATEHGYLGRDI